MNEKALRARDAKRDIAAELLQAVRDAKAGKGKPHSDPAATLARQETGMSQSKFAAVLGVSPRTFSNGSKVAANRRAPLAC